MNPLASEARLPGETKSGSNHLDFEIEPDKAADDGGPSRPPRGPGSLEPVPLSRWVSPWALGAILSITAARQIRGRRLVIFSMLFSLPILFAVLAHRFADPYVASDSETVLILGLIPQALLPLTALLYASGMVQDEVEEQTLTYLLIRPVPRWLIYVVKVVATWLVASALATFFTAGALVAIYWGVPEFEPEPLMRRAALITVIMGSSLFAYVAIFGALSLMVRRSLVLGVGYIVVFEGALANIDFVMRRGTVMYYLRVLSVRWLDLAGADWSIDPAIAPTAITCLLTQVGIGVGCALLGSCVFSMREFRVKTPEGS
jgi:ABC-2 type transport system permease protein